MSKDYYNILGINKSSSKEEIKKAYRKLAHKYHPDKQGGDEKKFKEINEAYQVLSNDQKKSQYDQFGSTFDQSGFSGQGSQTGGGGGINIEDLFKGFGEQSQEKSENFGDFGDIFGDVFGNRRTRYQYKQKAKDIIVDLEVSLEDIYSGLEKEIKLRKTVKCPQCKGTGKEPGSSMKKCSTCNGRGEVRQTQRTILGSFSRVSICPDCLGDGKIPEKNCSKCKGQGRVRQIEVITISIPSGIDDGQIIKLEGHGEAGGKKEVPGDLYVRIHIKKHKYFIKKGDDIYYQLLIDFTQAALGDKVEIPTLDKKVKLKIPAGILSGKFLRIKNKGMPKSNGFRGVQYAKLQIKTPQKLSKKAKELLKKLKQEKL